jgi:hypothetical protein
MPEMSLPEVERLARQAVSEHSLPLEIVGVVRGGSDSDYVEILVTIDRCPTDPYRFSLGVFRNAPEAVVRQEIATLLKRHVEDQH